MILEDENWSLGYDTLLEESRPGTNGREEQRSILILCNADVDAMASARILTYLLRSDAIPYQLLPCTSYQDLRETLRSLHHQMEQFSAIVLLNFGACYNLTKLYYHHSENENDDTGDDGQQQQHSPLVPETIKTFVLDCRRPVHLANIYEESAVVVFMNESKDTIDHFPSDGDDLSGIDDDDDDDDSDDDTSDSDTDDSDQDQQHDQSDDDDQEHQANFDDVQGTSPPSNKTTNDNYDGEDENDREDDDDDDDRSLAEQRSPKRPKMGDGQDPDLDFLPEESTRTDDIDIPPASPLEHELDDTTSPVPSKPLSQRELRKDRAQRLIRYYDQGSYFAAPASFMAYRMAEQLRQGQEGDLLWLACVGLTDAYLHARVDRYGFAECGHVLKNSCRKLFPDTRVDRALNSFDAEHLNGTDDGGHGSNGPKTKIKFSDNGRILAQNDYRFFLLRHSNLLDSMLHSDYVYAKMQMNTKKGQQRFMEMLAKMGLPLDECRQPFRFMKTSLRTRLKTEFENHADVSNCNHCVYVCMWERERVLGYCCV
jgi:cell division control protein 45